MRDKSVRLMFGFPSSVLKHAGADIIVECFSSLPNLPCMPKFLVIDLEATFYASYGINHTRMEVIEIYTALISALGSVTEFYEENFGKIFLIFMCFAPVLLIVQSYRLYRIASNSEKSRFALIIFLLRLLFILAVTMPMLLLLLISEFPQITS